MSAVATAIVLTAAAVGYSGYQQKKSNDDAEDRFKQDQLDAKNAVDAAKQAEADAATEAKKKADDKRLALETSGRASTLATSAFGLQAGAPVKKKKLGQ